MKFLDELKRRNVFRIAGLYGVVGWLLAQAASLLQSTLSLPSWFAPVVVCFLLIGFPVALIFAWAFELTPEGVKLTRNVTEGESITPQTGRKLDFALIGAIGLLVAAIVGNRIVAPQRVAAEAGRTASVEPAQTEAPKALAKAEEMANTIAVLPFVDMSPNHDQDYFSDGMTEELLNTLAQVSGLEVAGRTSSFAYKGKNIDLRRIGEELNVAHIVEGSVRKAGDKIRVTAQLINVKDGYHEWSQTFDRELTDIFSVQDEISRAIVTQMGSHLPGVIEAVSELKPATRTNMGAYDLYLLAREKMTQDGTKDDYESALNILDSAIEQDPHYTPALAWRAYAEGMLTDVQGGVGDTPVEKSLSSIKSYADRAFEEDPKSAEALFALGSYYGQLASLGDLSNYDEAISYMRKAVEIRPNFDQAANDLAYYLGQIGEIEESMNILHDILSHDPGLRDANVTYIFQLLGLGRFDEAEATLNRWAQLRPDLTAPKMMQTTIFGFQGKLAEAWRATEAAIAAGETDKRIARFRSYIRLNLGDADWIRAHPDDGNKGIQSLASIISGDEKTALDLYQDDLEKLAAKPNRAMSAYLQILHLAGMDGAIVEFYDKNIRSPDRAVRFGNICNCSLAPLAAALKTAGHQDFHPLMAAWKTDEDRVREVSARSGQFFMREGDRLVLAGDKAGAQTAYSRAIDFGWRSPLFTSRRFAPDLPDGPEFDALLRRMTSLINEERAKLGMPPFSPKG